jgi:hypothetical protein
VSDEEELRDYLMAEGVADALKEGDFEAFADLVDLLRASCGKEQTADFALGLIWGLLPDEAHDRMIATAQAEGRSNVIDLFTRKPRGE